MRRVVKIVGIGLLAVVVLLAVVYALLPKGPREQMAFDDPWRQERQLAEAQEYIAVAGTPWATQAAVDVLEEGGTAADAAVAALLMLNVTFGQAASFPCIAPFLVYDATTGEVRSYIGAGTAPAAATIDLFKARGHTTVPKHDVLAHLIPASPDAIVALLERCGTRGFAELSAPAIALARDGFPVHMSMLRDLDLSLVERLGFTILMPYNSKVYLRGEWWRPLHHKDRFIRPDLSNTLHAMADAETRALADGATRAEALHAVRDYFYTGPLADAIVKLHEEKNGLITADDLANYTGAWEEPVHCDIGPYTIYTNGVWSQGIVNLMTLQTLHGIDLAALGHNSPAYIHTVVQAIDLAMADREAYVADPAFVDVPVRALVSEAYAAQRRAAMTERAFGAMPPAGDPFSLAPELAAAPPAPVDPPVPTTDGGVDVGRDTSYLAVIDRAGNSVSMTPSDFPNAPMVPGTGMTLGIRMTQFRLDPDHPAALEPGKRPRVTPHALMVFRDGKFLMSIGTPGGDQQPQANVQVLLNMIVFGMNAQDAVNAPRFRSRNFPDSFAPHAYEPGLLELEQALYDSAGPALTAMGYRLAAFEDWDNHFSAVGVALTTPDGLRAAADPRDATTAAGR